MDSETHGGSKAGGCPRRAWSGCTRYLDGMLAMSSSLDSALWSPGGDWYP